MRARSPDGGEGTLTPIANTDVELDYHTTQLRKSMLIRRTEQLSSLVFPHAADADTKGASELVVTDEYAVLSADLRDLASVSAALETAGVDPACVRLACLLARPPARLESRP